MAFEQTNGLIASEHAVTNIPLQLISCCYLRKEEHMQTSEQVACTADNSRMLQEFIASSKVLHHELEYVGGANLAVPIIGESERGKELCACAVHRLSHRSSGAFVRTFRHPLSAGDRLSRTS